MKNNYNACVFGAGNIGKHHINSLKSYGFNVYVVDPVDPEIDDVFYYQSSKNLNFEKIDIFIISTTSEHHYKILEDISVNTHKNKNIIVEKPIFNKNIQYKLFNELLHRLNHNFFCNLPFFYMEKLRNLSSINGLGMLKSYSVHGTNWGLGCNVLHDISIAHSITNTSFLEVSNISFDMFKFEKVKDRVITRFMVF